MTQMTSDLLYILQEAVGVIEVKNIVRVVYDIECDAWRFERFNGDSSCDNPTPWELVTTQQFLHRAIEDMRAWMEDYFFEWETELK